MRVPPGPAGQTQAACQGTPGLCCLSGALALGVLRADLHRGNENNYQISKEHNQECWVAAQENYIGCIEMDLFNGRKETTGASLWTLLLLTRKRMYGFLDQWGWEALWESWKWLRYSPQPIPCNTLTARESHSGFFECIQLHARTEGLKESLVLSSQVSNASKQAAEQTGEEEKAKAEGGGEKKGSHMDESLLGLWRLLSLKEIQP